MRRVLGPLALAIVVNLSNAAVASEGGPTTEDVTFVQGLLSRLGYDPGPLDGICGHQTVDAVRSFHESHNLPLQPGDIEPQATTIVENLTTIVKNRLLRPDTPTSHIYRKALEGDAEAAFEIGTIYFRGETVVADNMLAYLWWTVAKAKGKLEASKYLDDLVTAGKITGHEMVYATSLAEDIVAPEARPEQITKSLSPQATM